MSALSCHPNGCERGEFTHRFHLQVAQEPGQKLLLTYFLLASLGMSTTSGAFNNCPSVVEIYRRSLYPREP